MANQPVVLTQEQQATTLGSYLPGGKAFTAKDVSGTNIRKLLLGLGDQGGVKEKTGYGMRTT